MNLKQIVTAASVVATGLIASGAPAQAFSFSTNFSGASATGDITLNSVTMEGGKTVSNFALVQSASIVQNDEWTGGNSGAASSERGDSASGIALEKATNASVAASLGNTNLNNIIDGEDSGAFKMNLFFEQAVSNLFFWERGMNSDLSVQALDASGNLIGSLFKITRDTWTSAGYGINTTEIGETQSVGSWGLSAKDLGVVGSIFGVQVSADASHNGPDFKVAGEAAAVPEPTTMAGLALAGAGFAAARRRKKQAAQ
ncbi:MAG: exosortase-dependent surface protein XDP2 [Leptolyngbyaceae cyanobacterium bins.349]|nr:exosortase-dependent surface protein XDP2 [Leptolyngbyaceae cyanobacterium bins.349]